MRTTTKTLILLAVLLMMGTADMNAQGWLGSLKDMVVDKAKEKVRAEVEKVVDDAVNNIGDVDEEQTPDEETDEVWNETNEEKSQAGSSRNGNRLGTFDFGEFLMHYDYTVKDAGPTIAVLPVSYLESPAFINLQERLYNAIENSPEFYDEAIKMQEGVIEMNKASGEDLSDMYEKLEELREMKKNAQPVDKKTLRDEILSHAVCHKFFWRAEPLFEDMARVSSEYDPQKGWGVINAQGKTVIPFTHSEIYSPLFGEDDHMNVILGFNPDLGMSVYRTDGSLLTSQKFWGGGILPLRTLVVRFTKDTCGLMDENTGKILTTQKYETIKDNLSNLLDSKSTIIYGVRNGKNYILSKDGREIGELKMGDNTHEVIYY